MTRANAKNVVGATATRIRSLLWMCRRKQLPIDVILLNELRLYGTFGMQGQRFGTMLAMCEDGTLKPRRVVHQQVDLEGITGVLEAMGTYDTTGIVVIDRF
jgi:DNA-binding HxlR family transcriptional regulator